MKAQPLTRHVHSLRAQVLLWIILPLFILLIIFAFSSVNSHRESMQQLAMDENTRLVNTLANLLVAELENYALVNHIPVNQLDAHVLDLESLLSVDHPYSLGSIVLLDESGNILFSQGTLGTVEEVRSWPGISEVLNGGRGAVYTVDTASHGDVIAYSPVGNIGWSLVIREAWHSLTDPLIGFEQLTPSVLFIAAVISLLALFFGLRYVVQPLQELSLRTNHIGQGDLGLSKKPIKAVREIEDLENALNKMAYRLQDYQAALHDYLRVVTQTQEEERARLGRELHDDTVQTLIALGHKAQVIQRSFERSAPQTREQILELREMLAQATSELRRFCQGLHPHYLEELGLVTAFEILAKEVGAEFSLLGELTELPPEVALAVYRIAQEALNNTQRHAHAEKITLSLAFEANQLRLKVQDDGIGFEPPSQFNELTKAGHFGLIGMRERAQLIGGQLLLHSSSGFGTSVEFILPKQCFSSSNSH